MRNLLVTSLLFVLAGCGGGGGSSSSPYGAPPVSNPNTPATTAPATTAPTASAVPTQAPTQAPAQTPTVAPAPSPVLQTLTLGGSPGYVSPSGRTVYVLSADSSNNSVCTSGSGCLGLWPIVTPPAGATMSGGWSSFTRADGQTQLSYNGWPLYMYSGDSASGQTNGNGINSFGGVWSIARPGMASAPTPMPTTTPGPGGGGY